MKKLFVLLLAVLLTLSLAACAKREPDFVQTITVRTGHPSLTDLAPGDFPMDYHDDPGYARYRFNVYVAVTDGQLSILPNHADGNGDTLYVGKETVYRHGSLIGGRDGVFADGKRILEESCAGMAAGLAGESLLLFTNTDSAGYIRGVQEDEAGKEVTLSSSALTLDSPIRLVLCDWTNYNADPPREIYIVTKQGFYVLDAGDYLDPGVNPADFSKMTLKSIPVPDYWPYMDVTSMVRTDDGMIYIGEMCGVVGVDVSRETVAYYPVDHFHVWDLSE